MVNVMARRRKSADAEVLFSCNMAHVLTLKAIGLSRVEAQRDGIWCAHWYEAVDIVVGGIARAVKAQSRCFASRAAADAFVASRAPLALVDGQTIDIAVRDYLKLPRDVRRQLRGFCVPALEFGGADVAADAYEVGAALTRATDQRIPFAYQRASSASRRELLAGIVDVCATRDRHKRSWRLALPSGLLEDVSFVARSLGLQVDGDLVCGAGCELVPVRLERNRLRRAINSGDDESLLDIEIVPLAIDDYFGFSLDGNARFVAGARLVVTHNSNLLSYVHKLAPRGIYTSGKGSSAVGLTAYITKDPDTGESVLESGALVLSDRGVCCIDEFDKMSDGTRAVLHEVMEQQTVSVAKAGIVCTLNARTSILASANPIESRYNPNRSVVENLDLPPTLLSRFDLIYLVLDKPNEATDRHLARHLVQLYWQEPPAQPDVLPVETMTRYISYARKRCHPLLTDDAAEALVRRYTQMRRLGASNRTVSATPRQLESLVRLRRSVGAHAPVGVTSRRAT
jgi:DNA replicative helicase MCM subunit Mcm2 (Cdc46/Mcm family)